MYVRDYNGFPASIQSQHYTKYVLKLHMQLMRVNLQDFNEYTKSTPSINNLLYEENAGA